MAHCFKETRRIGTTLTALAAPAAASSEIAIWESLRRTCGGFSQFDFMIGELRRHARRMTADG